MPRKNRFARRIGKYDRQHCRRDSSLLPFHRPRGHVELLEPRCLLSADNVLGAGATAAIIGSFEAYGSLVQTRFDDVSTDFHTLVPGILLTERNTTGSPVIDDQDLAAPRMRDLLAIEVQQSGSPNAALAALDTNSDTVVSWNEAYRAIIVDTIEARLLSFDADNSLAVPADDIDADSDVDSDDVEKWVLDGLTAQFLGSAFPGSGSLSTWFDVDLDSPSTSGSGTFNLSFNAIIDFDDSYQIDLGLATDAEEIELPQWEFDFSGASPDVDPLNRRASITGEVVAPIAVGYAGSEAGFAATGTLEASVKAGGDGTASLVGKVVNVGFLGTQAGSGSELALSMEIDTEIVDPSSPTRLGFADTDGDSDLAEKLAFAATSSAGTASTGGSLTATAGPDAAFGLATPIRFDLTYQYQTGNSGPLAVSVNVSTSDTVSEARTALETAINATSLNGRVTVTESGGVLSVNLVGGNAAPLGFADGYHSALGGTLTGTGFDFDTDNDGNEDGDDTQVSFAAAVFLLSVAGGLPNFVTVPAGTHTTSEWEAAVQAALDAAFTPGTVTATVDDSDLDNVTLELSTTGALEIVDTNGLSLTMTAAHSITAAEITALDAADPDQRSRLFTSTTDTATDAFSVKLNLAVRDGLDFTPTGSPQLLIDSTFSTFDGPFDLPDSPPYFLADFNGNERFALPMSNTDFAQYLDFNVFGRAESIAMVQQLEGWLERLEQHVALAGFDIPLVQSVIGQVLDFSDMLHDTFLSDDQDDDSAGNDVGKLLQKINDLDVDNPSIIFFTAQELGAALDKLGILDTTDLPAGEFATYDATNRDILYSIDATHEIANLDLPVDFTLDLSPLGSIYSESNVSIVAEGGLRAFLGLRMGSAGSINNGTLLTTLNNGTGVDINDDPAITGALSVERVFGRLMSDAHFNVTIGAVTYAVTVDADDTETNLSTAELIADIKTGLTSATIISGGAGTADLNPSLDVVPVGDRIAIVAKAAVTSFSLSASTADSAYTQLGLQSGPASTVSVTSGPVVDPDGGDGGVLTITIFGSAAVALTIDNADGNVSVTDVVNDINEKIAASSLAGKIIASRLGDRIVFSAIDKAVYGFSVAADSTADNFFATPFATLNAYLTLTAANEPPFDSLARFGRLTSDATLTINGVAVTVDSDNTDGTTTGSVPNGSLEDLAADLNAAIAASSLGTTVVAEVAGSQLALRANSSAVTGLTVTTTAGNTARTEMGFADSQTAGRLGVTGNCAAPFYYRPIPRHSAWGS